MIALVQTAYESGAISPIPPASQWPILARLTSRVIRILGASGDSWLILKADSDRLVWMLTYSYEHVGDALRSRFIAPFGTASPLEWRHAQLAAVAAKTHAELAFLVRSTPTENLYAQREGFSLDDRTLTRDVLGPTQRVVLLGDAAHAMTTEGSLGECSLSAMFFFKFLNARIGFIFLILFCVFTYMFELLLFLYFLNNRG